MQPSEPDEQARANGPESDYDPMLSNFDTKIHCEEYFTGYEEWSDELQAEFEAANEAAQTVNTEAGMMLIPRECTHSDCRSSRCAQGQRIGGFDI